MSKNIRRTSVHKHVTTKNFRVSFRDDRSGVFHWYLTRAELITLQGQISVQLGKEPNPV